MTKGLITFYAMLLLLMMLTAVSGCMMFQRLNMQDIKAEKYFYRSYMINKSVQQINKIVYDYSARCRPLPALKVDPVTQKTAHMVWERYITVNPKIIGLIEFIEKDDGTTTATAYWYYTSIDGALSDNIIAIIIDSSACRDI
jgi:hypothetical protein